MNKNFRKHIDDLASNDDPIRLNALQTLLKITESRVDWVYEAWDHLLAKLDHENSYQRSIGILLLCNLAKSDTEDRLRSVLDRLLVHTQDEKFITSRQCIRNIWKAAATNKANRNKVLKHLEKRFVGCASENHSNLLRQDIIQSLAELSNFEGQDGLLPNIQRLIAKESDVKNRKKYEALLQAR